MHYFEKKFFYRGKFLTLWHQARIFFFFYRFLEVLPQLEKVLLSSGVLSCFVFLTKYVRQIFAPYNYLTFVSPSVLVAISFDLDALMKNFTHIEAEVASCNLIACLVSPAFLFCDLHLVGLSCFKEFYATYKGGNIFIFRLLIKINQFFSKFFAYISLLPSFYEITQTKINLGKYSHTQLTTNYGDFSITRPAYGALSSGPSNV